MAKGQNQELAKALKLLRLYSNMKSATLAKKIGLSSGYTSEIEGGLKTVSIDILKRYEKVFGVSPQFIMTFAEKLKDKPGLEKKLFETMIKTIAEY